MQNVRSMSQRASFLDGFKSFILRGNVVDLAIAVVIGAAFGSVITATVDDLIMPIIGIFGGAPDFSSNTFTINGSVFKWGHWLTTLISFLIVAAVIYFVVVKPVAALMARANRGEVPADPVTRICPECLSAVPIAAARCAFCTQPLPPVAATAATATR